MSKFLFTTIISLLFSHYSHAQNTAASSSDHLSLRNATEAESWLEQQYFTVEGLEALQSLRCKKTKAAKPLFPMTFSKQLCGQYLTPMNLNQIDKTYHYDCTIKYKRKINGLSRYCELAQKLPRVCRGKSTLLEKEECYLKSRKEYCAEKQPGNPKCVERKLKCLKPVTRKIKFLTDSYRDSCGKKWSASFVVDYTLPEQFTDSISPGFIVIKKPNFGGVEYESPRPVYLENFLGVIEN